MNKTLMLVICDFLLLSMLALARFDPPKEAATATLDATASSATAEAELIELLEESLQSELSSRQNLTEDLTETRESLQQKARALAEREAALEATQTDLAASTAQAEELARSKAQIEAEQAALAAEKARLEAESTQLAARFDRTRTELEASKSQQVELVSTLGQLKAQSSVTQEKLNQTEEELIAREIALAEREAALKAAEADKAALQAERETLNRQLEVAQAERRLLEQNLTQEQTEKQQLQEEKELAFARADRLTENVSQLGQGVSTLTQASEDIKKEIEAARPQTMSEIFTRFQNHRASLRFTATERGLFGAESIKTYESKSILIRDESGATYLVTHSANSPFAFGKNANNLLAASLEVSLANRRFPVSQIGFLSADPRILFVPLPQSLVDASGLETFPLALQPERWEEAVLVKNDESNFGRTGFRRLTESERFLKMDRPALGQLFADFASSRGDLAFTKNSQFIGLLTDTEHAVVINDFLASAITRLGKGFDPEQNAATLDRLRDRLQQLPQKVR
jgi:predicted nuclease with TOPRIM domain